MNNLSQLDKKFEKLKEYADQKRLAGLNKRIYNLNLDDVFLSDLDEQKLIYIHVKLHNALSFKKPFAPIDKIIVTHDRVAKLMKNHKIIDDLDKNFRNI